VEALFAELNTKAIGNSKSHLHKTRMKLRKSLKTSRVEKATKQYWEEMKYELRAV
jgi:hypothetical protein